MNNHNCRNCGAPVIPGESCEYCGTYMAEEMRSEMNITADGITLVCDKIDRFPPKDEIIYWAGDKIVGHEFI